MRVIKKNYLESERFSKFSLFLSFSLGIPDMMLTKDANELIESKSDDKGLLYFPRVAPLKREPGAILSWAIPAASNKVYVFKL